MLFTRRRFRRSLPLNSINISLRLGPHISCSSGQQIAFPRLNQTNSHPGRSRPQGLQTFSISFDSVLFRWRKFCCLEKLESFFVYSATGTRSWCFTHSRFTVGAFVLLKWPNHVKESRFIFVRLHFLLHCLVYFLSIVVPSILVTSSFLFCQNFKLRFANHQQIFIPLKTEGEENVRKDFKEMESDSCSKDVVLFWGGEGSCWFPGAETTFQMTVEMFETLLGMLDPPLWASFVLYEPQIWWYR